MNRRDFFKAMGAVGATAVAVAAMSATPKQDEPEGERPAHIPYVQAGEPARAVTFNAMIKAINEQMDARWKRA